MGIPVLNNVYSLHHLLGKGTNYNNLRFLQSKCKTMFQWSCLAGFSLICQMDISRSPQKGAKKKCQIMREHLLFFLFLSFFFFPPQRIMDFGRNIFSFKFDQRMPGCQIEMEYWVPKTDEDSTFRLICYLLFSSLLFFRLSGV